jgi:hypothetical protein
VLTQPISPSLEKGQFDRVCTCMSRLARQIAFATATLAETQQEARRRLVSTHCRTMLPWALTTG